MNCEMNTLTNPNEYIELTKWKKQINENKANCRQILSVIANLSAHTLCK